MNDQDDGAACTNQMRNPTSPPSWFVGHGNKMGVDCLNAGDDVLRITNGSVATLSLARLRDRGFMVMFSITHASGQTSGRLGFSKNDLRRAFSNRRYSDKETLEFANACGKQLDAGEQGLYFRLGNYLNIPCPGTGMQGDSNVSIYITPEIRRAVMKFLSD